MAMATDGEDAGQGDALSRLMPCAPRSDAAMDITRRAMISLFMA